MWLVFLHSAGVLYEKEAETFKRSLVSFAHFIFFADGYQAKGAGMMN